MARLREALLRIRVAASRWRSLVRDEDHDEWYEKHTETHDKPPNLMGPGAQGGG
jgi:hypothetical protein